MCLNGEPCTILFVNLCMEWFCTMTIIVKNQKICCFSLDVYMSSCSFDVLNTLLCNNYVLWLKWGIKDTNRISRRTFSSYHTPLSGWNPISHTHDSCSKWALHYLHETECSPIFTVLTRSFFLRESWKVLKEKSRKVCINIMLLS